MNIQVHITQVLQPRTGTSKNNKPYTIYQYVGETVEQYSRKILFTQVTNEPLPADTNAWGTQHCPVPQIGADVDIYFDLETRIFPRRDGTEGYDTIVKPYRIVSLVDDATSQAAVSLQPQQLVFQQTAPPQSAAYQQPAPPQPVYPGYQQPYQ